jgi:hypothetical protein
MNNLLGTKFKMVMGYKSSEDLNLALQRGEMEARAFSMASVKGQRSDWVKERRSTSSRRRTIIARTKSPMCRF